jgi:Domain of unknown function (DUF4381)
MTTDAASLARLHDIVVPPPVPWWPPAPGWLWLLGFAALVALALSVRGFIHSQQNRYRREALAELSRLEATAKDAATHLRAIEQIAGVLKRAALTAYGRETVAALTGPDWFAFLDRTGGTRFGAGLGAAMENALYRSAQADTVDVTELAGEVRKWIRNHVVPKTAPAQAPAALSEASLKPVTNRKAA